MIERTTLWTNDRGETVQVAVACLSDLWEPLVEHVLPVGPFDDDAERLATACRRAREWYALHGEQASLFDDATTP